MSNTFTHINDQVVYDYHLPRLVIPYKLILVIFTTDKSIGYLEFTSSTTFGNRLS